MNATTETKICELTDEELEVATGGDLRQVADALTPSILKFWKCSTDPDVLPEMTRQSWYLIEVVWVILAPFERLSCVAVVAVGMWATRLRCPSCPPASWQVRRVK